MTMVSFKVTYPPDQVKQIPPHKKNICFIRFIKEGSHLQLISDWQERGGEEAFNGVILPNLYLRGDNCYL